MEPTQPTIPSSTPVRNEAPNVATPSGSYPVMGTFFERLVAAIIDAFIVVISGSIIASPLGFMINAGGNGGINGLLITLQWGIEIVILVGYYIYFYTKKGQSLGKQVMKLKVVNSDDLKYLTPGKVVMRELVGKFVSGLVVDLGYLWYFMSEKRQTWHDSIALTYVVKTDEKGEILMNGPAAYEKKPVFAFLPCGCFLILFILMFIIFGAAIIAAVNPNSAIRRAKVVESVNNQKQIQLQDLNTGGTTNSVDVNTTSDFGN